MAIEVDHTEAERLTRELVETTSESMKTGLPDKTRLQIVGYDRDGLP